MEERARTRTADFETDEGVSETWRNFSRKRSSPNGEGWRKKRTAAGVFVDTRNQLSNGTVLAADALHE